MLAAESGRDPELHSVHSYDPHEVMHALAHETWGEPPAFFDEGLATGFGWDWTPEEQDVHERAVAMLDQERLVPLRRLLTNWDFRSYKTYPAYTTAGSFIKYLLATYGPEKLAKLFELDRFSPLDEIEACFATTYGAGIYQVEAAWRAQLQGGALVTTRADPRSQSTDQQLAITAIILLIATFLGAVVFIVAGEKAVDAATRRLRALGHAVGTWLER